MSQRRACQVLGQPRSTQRYQAKDHTEEEKKLVTLMHELVRKHPRYGYRFITAKLRQEGWKVNFKRIYRLWRQEGFKVPKKTRKKRRLGHSGNSCIRRRAEHKDHVWAWDFIHDRTATGQPLKWLAITDEYTRECLALEVSRSITSDRVLDILTNLFLTRGVPMHLRSDNGPEFIAEAIQRQSETVGLEMLYIEPGSPWENGFAEWIRRIVFQPLERRAAKRRRVHELGRGPMVRETASPGAQRIASTQQFGLPDPSGIRIAVCCFRSGCALTPTAHCGKHYLTHTLITRGTRIGGTSLLSRLLLSDFSFR